MEVHKTIQPSKMRVRHAFKLIKILRSKMDYDKTFVIVCFCICLKPQKYLYTTKEVYTHGFLVEVDCVAKK